MANSRRRLNDGLRVKISNFTKLCVSCVTESQVTETGRKLDFLVHSMCFDQCKGTTNIASTINLTFYDLISRTPRSNCDRNLL